MLETQNSRERLLDAADELMYERGYEAVSVADLCAAADARKGSFYHWWPSKRDAEFLADGLAANRDKTGHVVGCRFGNFAVELSTRDNVVRERVANTLSLIAGMFETAIRGAMKRGELPDGLDATDIACAILAQMEGLMVIAKANDDPDMLRRLGRDALKLMGLDVPEAKKRRSH